MPRDELQPVTMARIENSNTWGRLYSFPCARRGSGTSANKSSNGPNPATATPDFGCRPRSQTFPIRESAFLSVTSLGRTLLRIRLSPGGLSALNSLASYPPKGQQRAAVDPDAARHFSRPDLHGW